MYKGRYRGGAGNYYKEPEPSDSGTAAQGVGMGVNIAASSNAARTLSPALKTGTAGVAGYGAGNLAENIADKKLGAGRKESEAVGLAGAAGAGFAVGGPPGAAAGAAVYAMGKIDTWLCTAIHAYVGMSAAEHDVMTLLRGYASDFHRSILVFYVKNGKSLTDKIKEKEADLPEFYGKLKAELIDPIMSRELWSKPEESFQHYKKITWELFGKYLPELELP